MFGSDPFFFSFQKKPSIANIAYAVFKPLVSKSLLRSWRLGAKMDGFDGRLDTLFAMPNIEAANESMLKRVRGFLKERYENEKYFTLPDRPTDQAAESAEDAGPREQQQQQQSATENEEQEL